MNQVQKMSSIQDCPEEIILKVIKYLDIKDLVKFSEVSKQMRGIGSDQSLWRKINLSKITPGCWSYAIDVPTDFVKMVIENGCQYLSLHYMKIGTPEEREKPNCMTSERNLCLDEASSLRYLDLKYCEAHVKTFEEILASCYSLEKLSMASIGQRRIITSNMIRCISYQNGLTLQTLNLSACSGLTLESIQMITINCIDLKNIDFSETRLSKDSISFLVNNLTPTVEKLSLGYLENLKDKHVKALVARCSKLSVLNLGNTTITDDSLTHIIENLQFTLEQLDIHLCHHITYGKLTELKYMPILKKLNWGINCDEMWIYGVPYNDRLKKEDLKKLMPFVKFGETVSADERKLSPVDGIWDIEAKQLDASFWLGTVKLPPSFYPYEYQDLPNEFTFNMFHFLEIRDLAKFGQVSKKMRILAKHEIWLRSREICQRLGHPISQCQKCLCLCQCRCKHSIEI